MVYGFMKQSGGHINVYSEPGLGTTFRLYFPRAGETADQKLASAAIEAGKGQGESVLVVEDNPSLLRVATRQLQELGYHVLEADNALGALAVLEKERVNILFSDVVMPGGVNGFDLAHEAQTRWPELRVVLTSGFPDARLGNNERYQFSGRLLNKPYRKQDLAKALRETLENASPSLTMS
jgi:CheY-like chemotaxis protein